VPPARADTDWAPKFVPVQFDANPPGTDWDFKNSMETWSGAQNSFAGANAASNRQAIVNLAYRKYLAGGAHPVDPQPPSVTSSSGVVTLNNGVTFLDRNDDGSMDMAEQVVDGQFEVNFGSGADFDSGWMNYSSFAYKSYPPPPSPGLYPDNGT
jgi:hypothetical protein